MPARGAAPHAREDVAQGGVDAADHHPRPGVHAHREQHEQHDDRNGADAPGRHRLPSGGRWSAHGDRHGGAFRLGRLEPGLADGEQPPRHQRHVQRNQGGEEAGRHGAVEGRRPADRDSQHGRQQEHQDRHRQQQCQATLAEIRLPQSREEEREEGGDRRVTSRAAGRVDHVHLKSGTFGPMLAGRGSHSSKEARSAGERGLVGFWCAGAPPWVLRLGSVRLVPLRHRRMGP